VILEDIEVFSQSQTRNTNALETIEQQFAPSPRAILIAVRDEVAKVIEFYIPINFRRKASAPPPPQVGRVIEFRLPEKKPA